MRGCAVRGNVSHFLSSTVLLCFDTHDITVSADVCIFAANMHYPAAGTYVFNAGACISAAVVRVPAANVRVPAAEVRVSVANKRVSAAKVGDSAANVHVSASDLCVSAANVHRLDWFSLSLSLKCLGFMTQQMLLDGHASLVVCLSPS